MSVIQAENRNSESPSDCEHPDPEHQSVQPTAADDLFCHWISLNTYRLTGFMLLKILFET